MRPRYTLDRQGRIRPGSPARWPLLILGIVLLISGLVAWYFRADLFAPQAQDNGVPALSWEILQTLDYATGQAPPALRAYASQRIKLPGFLVLLDAVDDRLTEFLLVPVYGMCIHVPPPPPNLMVHVKDQAGIKAEEWMAGGVWLEGVLHIEKVDSDYGAAGFTVTSARLSPLQEDDPQPAPAWEAPVFPHAGSEPIL